MDFFTSSILITTSVAALIVLLAVVVVTFVYIVWRWQHTHREMVEMVSRKPEREAIDDLSTYQVIQHIAHDISNPLQGIVVNLDNLRRADHESEFYARTLDQIEADAIQLMRWTEQLKALAQLEGNNSTLSVQRLRLRSVIERVVADKIDAAEAVGIELSWPQNETPIYVNGNRDLLTLVLNNLVDNSLKYRRPESRAISIGVATHDDLAKITVSDDGAGIAHELLPLVFTPGYRVPDVRTYRLRGSGLGLALVDRIVRLHGGVVSAESEYGQGTIISFTLPLAV